MTTTSEPVDADALVARMFAQEGTSLVRLARFFCDDHNAAEDLVQEAFVRSPPIGGFDPRHRSAPAFLRSIVINLARDHNRRGLMSLRHRNTAERVPASRRARRPCDRGDETARAVLDALRHCPNGSGPVSFCTTTRSCRSRGRRDAAHLEELGEDPLPPRVGSARSTTGRASMNVEQRLIDALRAGDQDGAEPRSLDACRSLDRRRPGPSSASDQVDCASAGHRCSARDRRRPRAHRWATRPTGSSPGDGADRDRRARRARRRARACHPTVRSRLRQRPLAGDPGDSDGAAASARLSRTSWSSVATSCCRQSSTSAPRGYSSPSSSIGTPAFVSADSSW